MKFTHKLLVILLIAVMFGGALQLLQGLVTERAGYYLASAVDQLSDYRLVTRSVKYGLLFLILTYGIFALFETLKGLRIHPIQYLLVGTALAMFYLLLLSITEHIGFSRAYMIAASVCVGLIVYYVAAVLQSYRRALLLGALLGVCYWVIFVLLHTEVYTLLVGSVLLFVALAGVMIATRNIDWYQVGMDNSSENRDAFKGAQEEAVV